MKARATSGALEEHDSGILALEAVRSAIRDIEPPPAVERVALSADAIDALPAAIYTTDADGRVTSFNKACVAFSGRVPELDTDRWCVTWKLFWPNGRPMPFDECPMAVAIQEGRPIRGAEAIAERPDGSRIWFAAHPTPLFDSSGALIGGVNMLVDITARKTSELSLARVAREQGALYRFTDRLQRADTQDEIHTAALDAIIEGLAADRAAILRYDEAEVMRFVASRNLSARYRSAVEGHSPWRRDDPDPSCVVIADIASSDLDEHLKAVIARERIAAVAFIPLVSGGRLIGKFMMYYDTTHRLEARDLELALTIARQLAFALDRQDAEQARRASAMALQEADRRKDEFLATLAHELRNPLAPIRNALPLIARDERGNAESGRWLEILDRQTARLTRLVDDLLDVSRITRGHIDLRTDTIDLAALVNRVVDAHADEMAEASLTMERDVPAARVPVLGDPVRLEQVITNVLSNAIKYTDAGGSVGVRLVTSDQDAELTVRDTGIGIEPAFLARMFTLFEQADRALDRSKGGLGIGLALARQLVELHRGTIAVESEGPGNGTRFIVRLPLAAATWNSVFGPASHEAEHPASSAMAGHRVLVVDDNVDYADVLAELVRQIGYEVQVAYDGATALRLASDLQPTVVLLDIGLPGINGYEVAEQLRTSPATAGALLVAVSGYGQPADRARSAGAGFDRHLVKPIELDAIEGLLRATAISAGQLSVSGVTLPPESTAAAVPTS